LAYYLALAPDRHDEILLKVALDTIKQTNKTLLLYTMTFLIVQQSNINLSNQKLI
jgi:hypothetical protein